MWVLVVAGCLLAGPSVLAEGKVTGMVTGPDGAPLPKIQIVLEPQGGGGIRIAGRTNKKGQFFFGIVRDGNYTLSVEDTDLVPHSIHLVIYDEEKKENRVDYDGPPPENPQVFEVGTFLQVTYDLRLGDAETSPAALARKAKEAQELAMQVPGLLMGEDYKAALKTIDEALARTPEDASLQYMRGVALFKGAQYEDSRNALEKALSLNPDQVGAHFFLGGALSYLGERARAIEEFRAELSGTTDEPTRVNCWINIGLNERELGHQSAAIEAFEKVVELDPSQAAAYSYLAELYLATNQADKAAEIEARAEGAGAQDPTAVFNIGANYWNSKEYEKARDYFERAVKIDPGFALAWKQLGYANVQLGKIPESLEALNRYLDLAPDAPDSGEIREMIDALQN